MCLSCAPGYDARDDRPTLAELEADAAVDRQIARRQADRDAETLARGGYVPSSRTAILGGTLSITLVDVGCIPTVTAVREGIYRITGADLAYVTDHLSDAWWDVREHDGVVWARPTSQHPFVALADAWTVDTTSEPPF